MGTAFQLMSPVSSSTDFPVLLSEYEMLSAYRAGSQDAAERIFHRYRVRVVRLIERSMGKSLRARLEPDDLLQWVFTHTFTQIRHASSTTQISGRIWPLMAAIAGNVVSSHARFWAAQRRDPRRTESLSEAVLENSDESPELLAAMREIMHSLLAAFPSQQRQILKLSMMGYSAADIVEATGLSERSIYRVRKSAERVLQRHLAEK